MTNYEWLLQMGGEERQAWFDAQHVDANDVSTRKGDVRADGVCANDVDVLQDSREELEADVREWIDIATYKTFAPERMHEVMLNWLDRQAAITERELCKQCDWPSLAAQPDEEAYDRIAELEAALAMDSRIRAQQSDSIDNLAKQRDALADDLLTCNKEREQYRDLFSEALTLAAEIVNLQP